MQFSLFPTSPPHAFTFVFSACFFHCSPFCFLFLFITFQRPTSHCPLLIPCCAEKFLQQQSFFEVSDKRCCWFSAGRPCDTTRAVGGFTAHVKIRAGLNFLLNLLKWLSLFLCMRRSMKFLLDLEIFSLSAVLHFLQKVPIYYEDWLLQNEHIWRTTEHT